MSANNATKQFDRLEQFLPSCRPAAGQVQGLEEIVNTKIITNLMPSMSARFCEGHRGHRAGSITIQMK